MLETTVVVIGGGATGMGPLRELCMRGVPAILPGKGGLAPGTRPRRGSGLFPAPTPRP